jgi:hypothetical protein
VNASTGPRAPLPPILDDVLLEDGKIAAFSVAETNYAPWAGTATCCSSVAKPT